MLSGSLEVIVDSLLGYNVDALLVGYGQQRLELLREVKLFVGFLDLCRIDECPLSGSR